MEASGTRGDDCPVTASWADSPDGPWTPVNEIIIPNGKNGEWDMYSIHDPYPLVYNVITSYSIHYTKLYDFSKL